MQSWLYPRTCNCWEIALLDQTRSLDSSFLWTRSIWEQRKLLTFWELERRIYECDCRQTNWFAERRSIKFEISFRGKLSLRISRESVFISWCISRNMHQRRLSDYRWSLSIVCKIVLPNLHKFKNKYLWIIWLC